MAARIVGLDIGQDTVRAVELENADKAKPTVVRYHEIALPEGAVRSGEVRESHTVTAALKRLWASGGFSSKKVVLGMGNQRVLARDLTVPKMGLVQIRESLPFQVQDMLPVPVSDALLDFYPISEGEGESGPVVHGLLIAAIKESVMANITAVRQAGLSPVQVDLIPFALSRVLVRGSVASGTLALIDVGANTTNVVIISDGVPQFVRMIPAGGENLTRALAARLEISGEQAEAAKRARGISQAPATSEIERVTAEVIHQSIGELLNSLRNTLHYFVNTRPNISIDAIVLSGGASNLPGFANALASVTQLHVAPADPFSTVSVAKTAAKTQTNPHAMTVALGLALGSVA
jgi:type IV pilus assembly protein PilM